MGYIKFPKWAIKLINFQLAHCFRDDYKGHHKYHLTTWGSLNMRMEFGGFGITDIGDMNLRLLASWISRYYNFEEKTWKNIIDFKYDLESNNIFACSATGASPFSKGVVWAAQAAKVGFSWHIGNGKRARFWKDHWFGNAILATQYWDLYNIANEHNVTIDRVWDGCNLKMGSPRLKGYQSTRMTLRCSSSQRRWI